MAKSIDSICDTCSKYGNGCCKTCISEHKSNVFSSLTEHELEFLVDEKKQIIYNKGETIIKQNTASTHVICINDGLAKIYVESENGKNVIVRVAKAGDFITGGGLFNGSVQHFSLSAITKVKCCLIDSSKLTRLFSENSDFAIALLRNHTKQNNFLLNKLVNHTQKYMPGRVADTLLYLSDEIFGSETFNSLLTRQELAEMSNMTKESFVRILHQFKDSKAISIKGETFKILDKSSLQTISKNG